MQTANQIIRAECDAVVAASVIAFAFVFLHPFDDGNGRMHRFLLHHVLASATHESMMYAGMPTQSTSIISPGLRLICMIVLRIRSSCRDEIVLDKIRLVS